MNENKYTKALKFNGQDQEPETFEKLTYKENFLGNTFYYLAFSIINDCSFIGIDANFTNHDCTLRHEPIDAVAGFLMENEIETLSQVVERKQEISAFLSAFLKNGWKV